MLSTPKTKGGLFLASSLCDGLEDNNIRQVATLLLNKDADPNVLIPIHGVTPFHLVIGNDSEEFAEEVTKLFLRHGGNPNVRSNDGMTPVHVAAAWGRINILQLLLANGGDPLRLDNDGRSPFHYAFDGKYFNVVTMLANYCENRQDEDDKPKYNMMLGKNFELLFIIFALNIADKVLVTNGDVIAEYVASKDMILDEDDKAQKNECSYNINYAPTAKIQNNVQTDKKEILNCSFVDLDFDLANLYLSNVMQKEKCLVSQIINHLSSSLTSSCTINETLHNKTNKQEESTITTSNSNTQSTSKNKCKDLSDKIFLTPTRILDNSIISMSPNFNTPSHRKRRNACRFSLTSSYICNDSIVSKSPNFTPVCTEKKNLTKTSHEDSLNVFKKYKTEMQQYPECNWYKKHVAQSTPRRIKKRSIYKFHSGRKRFKPYRYETDVTSDEFISNNILKSIDFDKTIFSDRTRYDILDTSSEHSLLNFNKSIKIEQDQHKNNLAVKLDEERYDETDVTDNNSDTNLLDTNSSFNQIEKENEPVSNFSNNKTYAKSGNNEINTEFIIRKKFIDKALEKSIDTNIKSTCTTESDSLHKENFVDCVDCDTKKLLNEDLNMNISKTCNLHAKNWYGDRFHLSPSYKSPIENNSLSATNLSIQCKKKIYILESQKSYSSKSTDSKGTEGLLQARELDVCNAQNNSSLLSYVSTQEYKYEDPEEGVILLERRLCVTPFRSKMSGVSSTSTFQSLPEEILFIDDVALRQELRQLGDQPGPITNTTRQLYQKRLLRLRNIRNANSVSFTSNQQSSPRNQISKLDKIKPYLELGDWLNHLDTYRSMEKQVFQEFLSPDPSRRWREGTSKTSFTYLLLDPRITQDLPNRSVHLAESEVWSIFLNAIFYIGKGKRSRPLAHLYDAFKTWVGGGNSTNRKINCILNIWDSDCGVICLHIFQNIIPVEAYTREAAMIDAIGKECLRNSIGGKYYGIAATWSMQQKQKFGRYLLYKALQIFLHEGESQIFPCHL
ncbi:Ankyrin repeat and LEM domain-containing protein 1 [Trachymyrmex septentrionalis]|uniref:Ankyrin repeat and LEM domain-containing protein 1 n=1 Tax=Trachymyrmex septentrionalis TaxID=34720 RepID=A0A195FCI9_9HYME|nr:Ankyrin repeat and LEM domain-containing protein 1 [Trachymyrmex septentrionalis]